MPDAATDLCDKLAADLDSAFTELVVTQQNLVFGVALRVLRNEAAAEDVAQEVFVRAYRALRRYPAQRIRDLSLRAWLARIALNTARTEVRSHRSHDDIDEAAESLAAPSDGPLRLVERRDERNMWARLLAALPDRYRLPVALRYVDGLSYAELAETLDRPLGSIKSDIHRGTALLRAAYDAEQRALGAQEAAS